MTHPSFRVDVVQSADAIQVVASGEIDITTSHILKAALCEMVETHHHVELHLRDVAYMDSSGIYTLLACMALGKERFPEAEMHLIVRRGSHLERVLTVTGLKQILDIRQTE